MKAGYNAKPSDVLSRQDGAANLTATRFLRGGRCNAREVFKVEGVRVHPIQLLSFSNLTGQQQPQWKENSRYLSTMLSIHLLLLSMRQSTSC